MSQKTTFKPFLVTASAVEIQVLTGSITSLSFGNFKDSTAISKASVPLATVIQLLIFIYFENFFSNLFTCSPPIN